MWKNIGLGLAKVGGYALRGAVWASQHPEVLSGVATAVGHPEVAVAVTKGVAIEGAVIDVVNTVKAGK